MIINNSFGKSDRLCAAKEINELFESGRNFNNNPFKIIWRISDKRDPPNIKILISVPKKYFAKAVERNLIKRRIREAYRRNKEKFLFDLAEKSINSLLIAFIFAGKTIIEYNDIENKVISTLQKLVESL
jgi:ribonuclease P protein component